MIYGKKTVIRPMEMEDTDLLHRWWNEGRAMEYSGLEYGFMMSRSALNNQFKSQIEHPDMYPSDEKMFIICRGSDMEPLGDISYRHWDKRNGSAEIGLELWDPEERGKGYGGDAMAAFIDFMFRHLNLHRIELKTAESNKRAHGLYYKLGFKLIGTIREGYYSSVEDCYTNSLYMDLLKPDWDRLKRSVLKQENS